MTARTLIATPLTAILACIAALHAYWALGGQWGSANAVPTINNRKVFSPTPFQTWIVCGFLIAAAIVVAGRAGWLESASATILGDIGIWVIAVVFLLRAIGNFRTFGFAKAITGTSFAHWDTWLYSPLCLTLSLLSLALAYATRR